MKDKAKVEKVYKASKKTITPTLLKFQNGNLDAISRDNTQFCQMLRLEDSKKTKAVLVVANGNVYQGDIGNSAAEKLTDSYICVRSKSTNKVRIIPIEQVLLKNNIYGELEKKHIAKMSEENSRKLLMKEFGGRKASRYITNQQNMIVNIDTVKDNLDSTLDETTLNDEGEQKLDPEQHLNLIRPLFNADAMKVEDVYNINDVIKSELMERLEEEAKTVVATDINKLPIKSEFLRDSIVAIQKATPSAEGLNKIKIIIYMDCLLNLIKSRVRSLKNFEMSSITEKVENDVRERFSDPICKQYMRTTLSTEKALCYFIVMALLISDDYKVDINMLTKELGSAKAKIIKFAHIVNARVKARTDILALGLPSQIPKLATIKRKFNR